VTFSAVAPPPSNVVVTKTGSPAVVDVGGQVTYRITATNQGPGTAEHAIVTDTPNAALQLVSVTPSQGTCAPTTPISCDVGPLAPGASATVVVVATATEAGALRNGVTVLPSTGGGDAGDVASETASSGPSVTIRKRGNRRTVRPGAQVRFTLTATARGRGIARQVRVCDALPRGMTVVDRGGAQRQAPGRRWCWTIASLAAGRSRSVHLTVRVSASSGRTVTNLAVLTFAN
jgi:large repetitive protein